MSNRPDAPASIQVRMAQRQDLPALVALYNHYVTHSHCTFDDEPFTVDGRQPWWQQFDGERWQCQVALTSAQQGTGGTAEQERLVGYACSAPLKPKAGYRTSAEVSVYLAPDHMGRGIGRILYEALFAALAGRGLHRAYAIIALPNEASVALHRGFGFQQVAHLHQVGRKFDRYWDTLWLEKAL
ncbi:MAG: N-acetyltransferase family protein [Pseudomonadales bacterium]